MEQEVRVRFPPSPTGYLHIGGARTAIFNWLFAQKRGGKLILRIEDTDVERSSEESIQGIIESLKWLGITWDEGPYFQSRFIKEHVAAAQRLVGSGHAYKCFCTKEELDRKREEARIKKTALQYDGTCRNLTPEEIAKNEAAGMPYTIRLKVPRGGGFVSFEDIVYGIVEKKYGDIEDFVILRSNGRPLYILSNTVDDIRDRITHVIRGQDGLANTPKQILIYKALGAPVPKFAHMSLTLDPKKAKISKRTHGELVAVHFYKERGFLPWAFVNYLALLGWSTPDSREIFSREELIEAFSLQGIGRANAIFDVRKDDPKFFTDPKAISINTHYLRNLPVEEIEPYVRAELEKAGIWDPNFQGVKRDWFFRTIDLIRTRYHVTTDFVTLGRAYFSDDYPVEPQALKKNILKHAGLKEWFPILADRLQAIETFTVKEAERVIREMAEDLGIKAGILINGIRTAVTGQAAGPGLFDVLVAVGQGRVVERLRKAVRFFPATSPNFIHNIIEQDLKANKNEGRFMTRFPPEPNGYLHIGHAKSICLNFGLAAEYRGICNLRFDDTNPSKEDVEYVESIKSDVRWLGFDWGDRLYYASDYFEKLYEYAVQLIKEGKAYVCDLSTEEIREYRGTLTGPGKESPYRTRPVEENIDLFARMRAGEFEDGSRVLRAKIDMSSPNMNMRDPTIYRIRRAEHHRTGNKWCIYPMYDFAHCLSDSIEGITHSLCSLEFEDNRPLYDWFLDELKVYHPQQIEFARLNLSYTVLSKRKLVQLVEQGYVSGWDDPRMPTLSGMRRRGYTPESIRNFCERIGVAKRDSIVDMALLEYCIREDLNQRAPRVMGVLRPLRVVIDNYPEDRTEELDGPYHPENPGMGSRKIPFSRVLYIERDDFREDPPKKFFRLAPGREVRLRYAYYIKCVRVVKDEQTGEVVEVHCTYDPETRGGWSKDGRKVKGTLHWVSASHSLQAEVRLYDRLFERANPSGEQGDFTRYLNPNSLETLTSGRVEPSLAGAAPGSRYQFERLGYFCVDSGTFSDRALVFNRTVTLRDSWAKIEKKTELVTDREVAD